MEFMIKETPIYADEINKQFYRASSHYVTLADRLRASTESSSYLGSIVADAIDEFKERNPQFKCWADIKPKLACAIDVKLSDIVIDITLQRLLMIMHVISIVDGFKTIKVQPIKVYCDPDAEGKYVCWDGQHTSIALYIIAVMALGEDPRKIDVPVIIHPSTSKAEMREVFMSENGDGKLMIDAIDKF